MGKGDFFGEQALLYDSVRTATIRAMVNAKCLSIDRENLQLALGENLQHIIYKNSLVIALERSKMLYKLDSTQRNRVIEAMDVQTIQDGTIVIQQGEIIGERILIILKGKLVGSNSGNVVNTFSCMGDETLD